RATVADSQPALQQRGAAALMLDADLCRLAIQRVAHGVFATRPCAAVVLFATLGHDVDLITCCSAGVAPEPLHQSLGLLGADVRALDPLRLVATRRDPQHVAVAEECLGA